MRSWGSANSVVGAYYTLNPTAWTYAPDPSRPAFDNFRNWISSERLTWQASAKNKVNLSYDQEYRCDCHRSVSALLTPEASAIRQYHPKIFSGTWSYPMTNRLLFSAGSNYQTLDYRPGPQPETPLETIGVVDSGLSNLRYRAVGPDTTGHPRRRSRRPGDRPIGARVEPRSRPGGTAGWSSSAQCG